MHPQDEAFMRAALALARRGLGRTAPNPVVAALVVGADGTMLGRAVTAPGGRPHAEALALEEVGLKARGATLYVTLEPCATRSATHYGPSCTDRILQSGIARVVIGAPDPSPHAAGHGAKRLREAGLDVVEHIMADVATELNLGHILRVRTNRPMVTIKLAQTADGFAGSLKREPLQITEEESRALVHRMRAQADVLVTGIGTILADDPRLDVRLPGMAGLSPMVVVLDTSGRIPAQARIFQTGHRVLVATASPEGVAPRLTGFDKAEVLAVPAGGDGHIDLAILLAALCARGVTRIMLEAGPTLAEAFARTGFCDELVLLTGAHAAGEGIPALGPALHSFMAKSQRVETMHLGVDTLSRYRTKS